MTRQVLLLLLALLSGVAAGFFHELLDLKLVADKAPVVLAVFMAALYVRLARGVPTFPFEKIQQRSAETALEALRHLRGMYGHAFVAFTFALVISIGYTPVVTTVANDVVQSVSTGLLVGALLWALATAYLIYRTDISLFKAQTNAVQEVVSDIAAAAAATSAETVRSNLRIDANSVANSPTRAGANKPIDPTPSKSRE
jgi:hypothetical protein